LPPSPPAPPLPEFVPPRPPLPPAPPAPPSPVTAADPLPQVAEFQRTAEDQVQFRFPSGTGTGYQVFQSATLEPLSWQALGPKFTATATETIHDSSINLGLPSAFFRIAPVH
jgi:hypothetical protein